MLTKESLLAVYSFESAFGGTRQHRFGDVSRPPRRYEELEPMGPQGPDDHVRLYDPETCLFGWVRMPFVGEPAP